MTLEMLNAYCLLPTAYCLLPTAYCPMQKSGSFFVLEHAIIGMGAATKQRRAKRDEIAPSEARLRAKQSLDCRPKPAGKRSAERGALTAR